MSERLVAPEILYSLSWASKFNFFDKALVSQKNDNHVNAVAPSLPDM
jgi:hypothetical protein